MCEHCGCQAVAAIEELTREHDRLLDHVRDAERAARDSDIEAARQACHRLQVILVPHNAVEEKALFPAMAREFPDNMHDLEREHRHIDDAVEALNAPEPPETWGADLAEAMTVLRHHILKEQDGVFPAALATLHVSEWEAVDDARAAVGSGLLSESR